MTLKKSMISIAAAGVIAASITGCGSSSSSGGVVSSTSQPTNLTVTDGYVVNFAASAFYSDGNESNTTYGRVILTDSLTKNTKAAGASQVKGLSTIDLTKDLTSDQIANLQRIEVTQAGQTTDGTTITYASYFDADGNGEFNTTAGDTIATTLDLQAPAGFKQITPLTTLVQARLETLTASDTNDTNKTAQIALALSQIATSLGIDSDDIKNVDPIDAVSSKPAYTLINSLLGDATFAELQTIGTSLSSATAATTPSAALTNIAAAGTSTAGRFTSAATQLSADSDMINSVSSWNLDKMRTATFSPVNLTASAADFNVTAIELSSKDVATVLGSGAKVAGSDLNALTIDFASSTDANVTNKALKLVIDVRGQETRISDDANVTSLTISIPLDINNTLDDGGLNVAVSGNVMWEGVDADGNTFYSDMNKSSFTRTEGTVGVTNGISFGTTTSGAATLTVKADDIIEAIDANSSGKFDYTDSTISDMKIALVDTDSALQKVNGSDSSYWGNTAIASVLGGINVSGKTIFKNSLTDGRASGAIANKAPIHDITLAGTGVGSVGTTVSGTTNNATTGRLVINDASRVNGTLAQAANDRSEVNSTISFSYGSYLADYNATGVNTLFEANSNATSGLATMKLFDVNTTSETNGDLNTSFSYTVTDEFGKDTKDTMYIVVNRAPYDLNISGTVSLNTTAKENATFTSLMVKDYDNYLDALGGTINATSDSAAVSNAWFVNASTQNVSLASGWTATPALTSNSTIGLTVTNGVSTANGTVSLNSISGGYNVVFTNATGNASWTTPGDFNITTYIDANDAAGSSMDAKKLIIQFKN